MPSNTVHYTVAMPEPQSHEFHIIMKIPALPKRQEIDLVLPAWAPGSYLVRDFARHVYDLRVARPVGGKGASIVRVDKARWRVHTLGQAVTISYRVFAFETSVRTSFLDNSHAFWNGTSLFFFVDGELDLPCAVAVDPPRGWQVSTALPSAPATPRTFLAHNYDELADSPFEVGLHERLGFRVEKTRFEVAFFGPSNADKARLVADLRTIVKATGAMFGGFPFDRYLFLIHALPARGGGLEHACSCTLDIAGFAFEDEKAYQAFAELAAHEFFHAWNVKRIRDRPLGPFDYTKENYTRLLWFHEGFTQHMESAILLRAGMLTPERYLKDLAEDWTRYSARPGRNVTPLSELSFEAWIKQYKPAENHTNRMVSYYDKGRWAGLLLDLILRSSTGGRQGLPDLFRRLWRRYGARNRAIDATIVQSEAEGLAGRSLSSYFGRFIEGTAELPVPTLLRSIGIVAKAGTPEDLERHDPVKARRLRAWCGLTFEGSSEQKAAVVRNVVPGSPAWKAGVTYGDEIVAIDGHRVDAGTVSKRLADKQPGQNVTVSWFRKDRLQSAPFRLARNKSRKWVFTLDAEAPAHTRRLRDRWLGQKS